MKNRSFILLLIICLLFFVSACSSANAPSKVEADNAGQQGSESAPASEAGPDEIQRDYVVGDTVKVGDLEITVCGVSTSEGEDFYTPEDGNVFYLMNVAVANKGDKPESISTMLMFDLRDSGGYSVSQSLSAQSVGTSGLDGTVLPGKVIRGDIGFEVPQDPAGYTLQINPDVFGSSGLFSVALDDSADNIDTLEAPHSIKTGSEIQIGETYTAGALEIVVNGVTTSAGKDYYKPEDGNEFLLVDISIINTGTETESVSSMLMFTLRDMEGFSHNMSISAASIGKGGLDGEVIAGKTMRGELGYEVPAGTAGLELMVNPSVFGSSDLFVVTLN
jgi:hypothetical protein